MSTAAASQVEPDPSPEQRSNRAEDILRVACACNATKLLIRGAPIAHLYCHCDDCQRMHGAAYSPEAVYPSAAVEIEQGNPTAWTLKRNPRLWCPDCGTRLFIDVVGRKLRGVNGVLLPKNTFRPAFHMNCRFAVAPVRDDLPHYRWRPPLFGGSDEQVEW